MSFLKPLNWRLARLQSLSAKDRWRLFQAGVGLPISALGVRLFGLRRWMRWIGRLGWRPAAPRAPADELSQARATARIVAMAARHAPYRGNCLSRSLTLWWLLLRQGIHSDLRIGVTRPPGQFEAHAWIEHQGFVINDRPDVTRRYSTFDRPINSAARFV
ncbi:MAG: lasso peptide biosynthesis B2 protein [Anaerolineales bacterium]